jgi:hypothetical protein
MVEGYACAVTPSVSWDQGLITETEYQALKAKILSTM